MTNISNEKILLLAKNSSSLSQVCKAVGSNNSFTHSKVKEILLNLNFDLKKFKGKNNSVLNDREKLEKIVKESYSHKEVLTKFGLTNHNETLKKYLVFFSISTEHFCRNMHDHVISKGKKIFSLEDFCIDSKKSNRYITKVILENDLIPYRCANKNCDNNGVWLGNSLTLQLEHKNGTKTDNRLSNLEFLCPNCHTQTATYGAKNVRLKNLAKGNKIKSINQIYRFFVVQKNIDYLINTISAFNSYSELLKNYDFKVNSRNINNIRNILELYKNIPSVIQFNKNCVLKSFKINFPPPEEIFKMLKYSNYLALSRKLNCSDNAIRKYLKRNGYAI